MGTRDEWLGLEGQPNAARHLVDRICDEDVPLLVLHDFDKAGFTILGTLRNDTRRNATLWTTQRTPWFRTTCTAGSPTSSISCSAGGTTQTRGNGRERLPGFDHDRWPRPSAFP